MLSFWSFGLCALQIAAFLVAARAERHGFGRRDSADGTCDIHHARRALINLSETGVSFCTSFLHTRRGATKTITESTTSTETCSVRTVTTTVHGTSTTFTFSPTIGLPQITRPTYSSTVFIPSGTSRPINKRAPSPPISTPTTLATCASSILSSACSSLIAPTTTTLLFTSTHSKHSCLTTTTETFTTTRHTTTIAFTFLTTSPPVFTPTTGVLTTTVPADCLVVSYIPGGAFPDGDIEAFPEYPDQPRSGVECCVVCHHTTNCIASEYFAESGECGFLVRSVGNSGLGVSDICPLGLQDFEFGMQSDEDGDILPGPCGY